MRSEFVLWRNPDDRALPDVLVSADGAFPSRFDLGDSGISKRPLRDPLRASPLRIWDDHRVFPITRHPLSLVSDLRQRMRETHFFNFWLDQLSRFKHGWIRFDFHCSIHLLLPIAKQQLNQARQNLEHLFSSAGILRNVDLWAPGRDSGTPCSSCSRRV